jgi:transcriptional regulator with XRE-family HTH domain
MPIYDRMGQDLCVPTPRPWPREEFVAWLDAVKARLGLEKDAHLAEYFGIGHTLISNWRSGKQRPSMATLSTMAAALKEDPRELWVLAGWYNAVDLGLVEVDAPTGGGPPVELRRLAEVYDDPRMDDEDRAAMLNAVRMVYLGVLADLDQRDRRESSHPGRRHTG